MDIPNININNPDNNGFLFFSFVKVTLLYPITPYKGIHAIIAVVNKSNIPFVFIIGHQFGVSIAIVLDDDINSLLNIINIAIGSTQYLLKENPPIILLSFFVNTGIAPLPPSIIINKASIMYITAINVVSASISTSKYNFLPTITWTIFITIPIAPKIAPVYAKEINFFL